MTASSERDTAPCGLGIEGLIPGNGTCVACRGGAAGGYLMCRDCWTRVPLHLADQLATALRLYRRGDLSVLDLRDAQWACLEAIR